MAVSTKKRLYISLVFPAVCLLLLWGVEGMERLANWDLSWLGIFPRSLKGIVGILTAPLIHGGWEHLVSNSTPFFFLSAGLIYFYRPIAPKVLLLIYLLSGLWVWVAGRQVWHIGLSGVIYGLAFFLFFSGVFRKNAQSLALALVVALFYGSMVWGVLPLKAGTSWESHLFGALAGILAAFHFRRVELAIKTKRYEWKKSLNGLTIPWTPGTTEEYCLHLMDTPIPRSSRIVHGLWSTVHSLVHRKEELKSSFHILLTVD